MNWYKQFSFPWIAITDFEASLKFYRDDLEFELLNIDKNETWADLNLIMESRLQSIKSI